MKNKLISQKTRSRASKVVLALFLCTIMISSLCSFTVGDTFTFPETPPEYDYQTYTKNEGETDSEFAQRVFNYGNFQCSIGENVFYLSVPFYFDGSLYYAEASDNGLSIGYGYNVYSLLAYAIAGDVLTIDSYTDNDYTSGFLGALIPPTSTESLTNVWDGILNWITTSISSLQNVFWQVGTVIDFNSDVDTSDAITINDTVLYRTSIDFGFFSNDPDIVVNGASLSYDDLSVISYSINDVDYAVCTFDGNVLFAINPFVMDGGYTNIDADYYFVDSSGGSLTLLGTLCCIAVTISVVFLLIGTIVNFLKLRS